MNLALVGPTFPFRGGIAHYTAQLAEYLGQQHAVRVYSFRRLYPNWLFPGRSQFEPGGAPLSQAASERWLVPWWPPSWRQVGRAWGEQKPDLVVLQWWVTFLAPMTAGLVAGAHRRHIPVVAICHNVLPHEHNQLDAGLARLALGRMDGLVVHSASDQQAAQRLLPGQAVRAVAFPQYSAFRSDRWTREQARQTLDVQGRVILFFGFVRPYKGLPDLLRALPAVLQDGPAQLLVVGEIWEEAEADQQLVERLQLGANVRFVNRYVPNEDVGLYFAAADLVVLPYRHATGSAAAQLAFALGVPVVATRAGSLAETVEEGVTGYLAEPGDVAGLADAIRRFFREAAAAPFRAAIAQRQSQSSWAGVAEAVLQFARPAAAPNAESGQRRAA